MTAVPNLIQVKTKTLLVKSSNLLNNDPDQPGPSRVIEKPVPLPKPKHLTYNAVKFLICDDNHHKYPCQKSTCKSCHINLHTCQVADHNILCPKVEITCINSPNGCNAVMKREELSRHLTHYCEKMPQYDMQNGKQEVQAEKVEHANFKLPFFLANVFGKFFGRKKKKSNDKKKKIPSPQLSKKETPKAESSFDTPESIKQVSNEESKVFEVQVEEVSNSTEISNDLVVIEETWNEFLTPEVHELEQITAQNEEVKQVEELNNDELMLLYQYQFGDIAENDMKVILKAIEELDQQDRAEIENEYEVDLMMMLNPEDEPLVQNESIEQAEEFTCPICIEEMDLKNAINCKDTFGNRDSINKKHNFCRTCITHHVEANVDEMLLSSTYDGIRCLEPSCENKITFFDISNFLTEKVLKRFENRLRDHNLASIKNIERCKNCDIPVEFELSPEELLFFECTECGALFCRLCKRDAFPDHMGGVTCEEMEEKESAALKLADAKSNVVIRKCPKCLLAFVKNEGCNRMQCRCGTTQCYICRTPDINYGHFCGCGTEEPCTCQKCKLYEDPEVIDQKAIEELDNQA